MSFTVETIPLRSISEAKALEIGELLARVWQKPEKDARFRADQLLDAGRFADPAALVPPTSCVVYDGPRVVGHAMIQQRNVRIGGAPFAVVALSKVCSDPERRGQGIGPAAARAAFAPIDAGVISFALFQTSHAVRPFYERLGACLVEQRIYNSLAEDPAARPFWDEVVMRYPSTGDWPAGEIDLMGPGY